MKKIVNIGALLSITAMTTTAFAQPNFGPTPSFTWLKLWIGRITAWTNQAVTFLMVLATLFFIWSVIRYIRDKGDDSKATDAKKKAMIQGIIGLAVIVGIWGIVNIINTTFGIGGGNNPAPVSCPPGQIYNPVARSCQ